MTEREWRECDDPQQMLAFLWDSGRWSERKARLFMVACCRHIWHLMVDERSREAVAAAERLADALLGAEERDDALLAACDAFQEADADDPYAEQATDIASALLCPAIPDERHPRRFDALELSRGVAGLAGCEASHSATDDPEGHLYERGHADECSSQCGVLRDLFGPPPYRPLPHPPLLAWGDGAVQGLAQAAYDSRSLPSGQLDPIRLAILADALEETGCQEAVLLEHLRREGVHVRGCWAVDLLLRKA